MEEIFYSFTFGGETLSLAAALATMKKIQEENVPERLKTQGEKVVNGVRELIREHKIDHVLKISGHPAWSIRSFSDSERYTLWQIKTLFLQEIFRRGVLTIGSHNMSFAHSDADIATLLRVYDEVFELIGTALNLGKLENRLLSAPLEPLFRVR